MVRARWLTWVLPLLTFACVDGSPADEGSSGATAAGGTERGGRLEIFSWWTSGGEQEALEELLEVHRERAPNASVVNAAVEFQDKARDQLNKRLTQGTPPDLFQANVGADLFQWVLVDGQSDDLSRVEDIQSLADGSDWAETFAPEVLEGASFEGKLYGVPVNVHRINTLYYRKDLFKEFGLEPPTTMEELLDLCDELAERQDSGAPSEKVKCLGLGNKWNWTLSAVTFEMILPAIAGADFYERYFSGKEAADAPEVVEALDMALELYCGENSDVNCDEAEGHFNADVGGITWDSGVKKLSEGTVLMAAMGDWAKGYLESDAGGSLVADEDFGVIPFPGTEGSFVYTSDCFALPDGAPNREGALSLLRTVGSIDGQIAFNRKKGSIPARMDISADEFDAVTAATMRDFRSGTRVPALSAILPAELQSLLGAELAASFERGSTEIVLNFLKANYRSFK